MQKKYLVFDIGGTFIKWAIVQDDYKILHSDKFSFDGKNDGADLLLEKIGTKIQEVEKENNISAIGISTAGVVDPKTTQMVGVVVNIKNFGGKNVRNELGKYTDKPIFVENDANAAAIGETTDNIIENYDNILIMTLGTDIGGGIVLNKQLYRGNGLAGEIGHQVYENRRWGEFFSAVGLTKLVKEFNNKELTTHEILESKDEKIISTLNYWYKGMANGIANLIVTLNFEAIIIGGGISESQYFDLDKITEYTNYFLKQPQFTSSYKLFKASKGNAAAIIGMAKVINQSM